MAVVLLAAGQARRFGGNKLSALAAGRPVAFHSAEMLGNIPFSRHFVVSGPESPDLGGFGFEHIDLTPKAAPMSRSIALGVAAVRDTPAQAVLIALADMPLVSRRHILNLVERFDGFRISSAHRGRKMPPAIFGRELFDSLMTLSGDRGASELLQNAPAVALDDKEAADIDEPGDLAMIEKLLNG